MSFNKLCFAELQNIYQSMNNRDRHFRIIWYSTKLTITHMQYFKFTTCSCCNAKCLAFSNFFQSNKILKLMLLLGCMQGCNQPQKRRLTQFKHLSKCKGALPPPAPQSTFFLITALFSKPCKLCFALLRFLTFKV